MKCPEKPRRTDRKKPANPHPERLSDTSDTLRGYLQKNMDKELLEKAQASWREVGSRQAENKPSDDSSESHLVAPRAETSPLQVSAVVLTEHSDGEAMPIIDVWRRLFGFSESRGRVAVHLKMLRQWHGKMRA